jgi:type IV pilus assembly protein PilP
VNALKLTLILPVAAMAVSAMGCDDAPPARKPPKPVMPAAAPAPEIPEAESDAPEVAYAYSPIGKRDPFRSFFEEFQQQGENDELTELQRFEVDQLKLTGIVTGRATPYAMVEDPNKKGHTLTRGTLLGKNWGRVATITVECVVIKEEYRDYTGRKVTNTISMCLPKPDELKLD